MKIAVLLSGGVDSSVALRLLQEQGYDVTAFYLKIWLEDELSFLGSCPWKEDLKYVEAVCKQAKVPLQVVSLQKEYFENVVAYTLKEVRAGRTPNPDVMCNNQIKFGLFFKKMPKGFDRVASGHYAQITQKGGHWFLKKSPDPIKDQTYFLANLKQNQLKKIIFPIGNLKKSEVRALAEKFKLPNKNRKDSQGICFLGKLKFDEFLKSYLGEKKGKIVEYESGKTLGEHNGYFYYTTGQRRGIRLPDGPFYVVAKNIKKNIVYVSKHYHEHDKKRDTFEVGRFNWFAGAFPKTKNLKVKIRHGEKNYSCMLKKLSLSKAVVKIKGNDQGIAPGQFAVFYEKNICLGSGMITRSF